MSHMVMYHTPDGRPGYHQVDELHDAASFVERLRNEEGVEHARIFRMEEVAFQFRPYYRVAVGVPHPEPEPVPYEPMAHDPVPAAAEAAAAALADPVPDPQPVAEPAPVAEAGAEVVPQPGAEPAPQPVAPVAPVAADEPVPFGPLTGNGSVAGRRGLFGR